MSAALHLHDTAATEALAAALVATMPARAVVHLRGDLGAGKSTFARAFLRTLGVTGAIRSPTYTLVERYPLADGEAAHLDLYRLADAAELDFLGLDELASHARLWLVEWPERGGRGLPGPDLTIALAQDGSGRRVALEAGSAAGTAWLERTQKSGALGTPV